MKPEYRKTKYVAPILGKTPNPRLTEGKDTRMKPIPFQTEWVRKTKESDPEGTPGIVYNHPYRVSEWKNKSLFGIEGYGMWMHAPLWEIAAFEENLKRILE